MEPITANPLEQFFRQPGLEVALPTSGRFMPEGSIVLNAANKIAVYPMQASDELLMTSPDALMSGVAIEKLIESCVPDIKQPLDMSSPDLDVLFIAIRAASEGNEMEVDVQCDNKKCNAESTLTCDLGDILATVKEFPETFELRLADNMLVYFRPHTLRDQTKITLAAYNENRRMQAMMDSEATDEERRDFLKLTVTKVEEIRVEGTVSSIAKIMVGDAEVTDRLHIAEFIRKADPKWREKIEKKITEVDSFGLDTSVPAECPKCGNKWTTEIEFNPSNFFGRSSSD